MLSSYVLPSRTPLKNASAAVGPLDRIFGKFVCHTSLRGHMHGRHQCEPQVVTWPCSIRPLDVKIVVLLNPQNYIRRAISIVKTVIFLVAHVGRSLLGPHALPLGRKLQHIAGPVRVVDHVE